MSKIDNLLFNIEKIFCLVMGFFMIATVSIEIFLRYCFGATLLVGIQEIAKWSFTWFVTMACATGVFKEGHVSVEYFVDKFFSSNFRNWTYLFTHSLLIVFLISVTVSGFPFAFNQWQMRATAADIPKTFIYLNIPLSMSLMLFHTLRQLISKIRSMKTG